MTTCKNTLTLSDGNSGSSIMRRAKNDLGSLLNVVFVVKKCVPPTLSLTQLFDLLFSPSFSRLSAILTQCGDKPADFVYDTRFSGLPNFDEQPALSGIQALSSDTCRMSTQSSVLQTNQSSSCHLTIKISLEYKYETNCFLLFKVNLSVLSSRHAPLPSLHRLKPRLHYNVILGTAQLIFW